MPTPYIKRVSDNKEADFMSLVPENPSNVTPVVEILPTEPNKDGHAARVLSMAGTPYRFVGVRNFTSLSAARIAPQQLRGNLVGKIFEATTKDNTVFQRLMCLRVRELAPPHEVLSLVGGLGAVVTSGLWGTQPSASVTALAYIEIVAIHMGDAT